MRLFNNRVALFADGAKYGFAPVYRARFGRPGGKVVLILGFDRKWFDFELRIGRTTFAGQVPR